PSRHARADMGSFIFPRVRPVIPRNRSGSAWTNPGAAFLRGPANVMLELRNLSKLFNAIPAVENVSFHAPACEITGHLGPNRSGKSTTMKMITGLLQATSGRILLDGQPIEGGLNTYKQRMGDVPEEPHLYGHLSGLEYLVMVGQLRNLSGVATADRIDGLLRL